MLDMPPAALYPIDTIKTRLQAMIGGGGFKALMQSGGGKGLYAGEGAGARALDVVPEGGVVTSWSGAGALVQCCRFTSTISPWQRGGGKRWCPATVFVLRVAAGGLGCSRDSGGATGIGRVVGPAVCAPQDAALQCTPLHETLSPALPLAC